MPFYENPVSQEIEFRVSEIKGIKTMKDGSTRFKFLGGPYNNMVFRVYPPYDTVVWPDGTTYDLNPPFTPTKSDKWCYVHNQAMSIKNAIRARDGERFDVV